MKPESPFFSADFMNDMAHKLREVLRQSPAKDLENNLKAGLSSMLTKLDMVSREEFDVQSAVLARTRDKLGQLEARLSQLENPGDTSH